MIIKLFNLNYGKILFAVLFCFFSFANNAHALSFDFSFGNLNGTVSGLEDNTSGQGIVSWSSATITSGATLNSNDATDIWHNSFTVSSGVITHTLFSAHWVDGALDYSLALSYSPPPPPPPGFTGNLPSPFGIDAVRNRGSFPNTITEAQLYSGGGIEYIAKVPSPAPLALMGLGLLGLRLSQRRKA